MSEERANYTVSTETGITREDLAQRDCARLYADPLYRPPTPDEVTGLIKLAGWSQTEAARVVGVNYSEKGSPTIRRWRSPAGSGQAREIPYAAWRLMLLTAGVVYLADDLEALRNVAER